MKKLSLLLFAVLLLASCSTPKRLPYWNRGYESGFNRGQMPMTLKEIKKLEKEALKPAEPDTNYIKQLMEQRAYRDSLERELEKVKKR